MPDTIRATRSAPTPPPRPAGVLDFTPDEERAAYQMMLLIRRFEEKAGQLYGMGQIGGFCHLYIGQEAVVSGLQMAAKAGDQVITAYRDPEPRHGKELMHAAIDCLREGLPSSLVELRKLGPTLNARAEDVLA